MNETPEADSPEADTSAAEAPAAEAIVADKLAAEVLAVEAIAAETPEATVRTRVRVPLRFGDGYSVDAELVTFHGLVDGGEHLAVVLG